MTMIPTFKTQDKLIWVKDECLTLCSLVFVARNHSISLLKYKQIYDGWLISQFPLTVGTMNYISDMPSDCNQIRYCAIFGMVHGRKDMPKHALAAYASISFANPLPLVWTLNSKVETSQNPPLQEVRWFSSRGQKIFIEKLVVEPTQLKNSQNGFIFHKPTSRRKRSASYHNLIQGNRSQKRKQFNAGTWWPSIHWNKLLAINWMIFTKSLNRKCLEISIH